MMDVSYLGPVFAGTEGWWLSIPEAVRLWLKADIRFNAHCKHWSCRPTQLEAVEPVTKVVRHGRYVTFQLAEVAVARTAREPANSG